MYTTSPSQGERHYLRILLHHLAGATSFTELKTTPNGVICNTFKETAIALGLLETDEEWDKCLSEAAGSFMPVQLHSLFVTILILGEPAKPAVLWEKYCKEMGKDLREIIISGGASMEVFQNRVNNEVLLLLQEELDGMGACLEQFGLPTPNIEDRIQKIPRVIQEEMYIDHQKEITDFKCSKLNTDQQEVFCSIIKAVKDKNHPHRMYFLNAPGGYGKTFLIEALLSAVRSMGKIALAVASSGIAAELLESGRTAHSHFKIPIPVHEDSVCSISL